MKTGARQGACFYICKGFEREGRTAEAPPVADAARR